MAFPDPVPGLVIRYSYLWRDEARRGDEEGAKDRPCVVVLAVTDVEGQPVVTVAPVTHTPPRKRNDAVELPLATKKRLGLDEQASWILSTEVNCFVWPGPDLRPVSRARADTFVYGFIPGGLLKALRGQIVRQGRVHVVNR